MNDRLSAAEIVDELNDLLEKNDMVGGNRIKVSDIYSLFRIFDISPVSWHKPDRGKPSARYSTKQLNTIKDYVSHARESFQIMREQDTDL